MVQSRFPGGHIGTSIYDLERRRSVFPMLFELGYLKLPLASLRFHLHIVLP